MYEAGFYHGAPVPEGKKFSRYYTGSYANRGVVEYEIRQNLNDEEKIADLQSILDKDDQEKQLIASVAKTVAENKAKRETQKLVVRHKHNLKEVHSLIISQFKEFFYKETRMVRGKGYETSYYQGGLKAGAREFYATMEAKGFIKVIKAGA